MIIAILSDPHANIEALDAVVEDAREQEAVEYWCLGDVVGYGPWPLQVWQHLIRLDIPPWGWVAGNHDWALVSCLDNHVAIENHHNQARWMDPLSLVMDIDGQRTRLGFFYEEASDVIEIQREALQGEQGAQLREALRALPLVASPRRGIYLTHGRFMREDLRDNILQYTRTAEEARWSLGTLMRSPFPWADAEPSWQVASCEGWGPVQLMIVGHTHIPALWCCRSAESESWCEHAKARLVNEWFDLENLEEHPVCLNPGSVGQPRDRSSMARYALLDWDPPRTTRICFRELAYDHTRTQAEMRFSGYPTKLIEALG